MNKQKTMIGSVRLNVVRDGRMVAFVTVILLLALAEGLICDGSSLQAARSLNPGAPLRRRDQRPLAGRPARADAVAGRRPAVPHARDDRRVVEGIHTKASAGNCFMMWMTLLGPDVIEMLTWKYVTNLARDLLLSILTLANHDPNATLAPRNQREFDAVRHAFTLGVHNLFLLAFKPRNGAWMKSRSPRAETCRRSRADLRLVALLGGIGVGLVGGFLGSLPRAGDRARRGHLGRR